MRTCTVTFAADGFFNRSAGSRKPTVTASVIVPRAPAMDTGSVTAFVAFSTELCGPMTSTVVGSAAIELIAYPGAGSPSVAGTTGTWRVADFSKDSATLAGVTCTTCTPNGARTC